MKIAYYVTAHGFGHAVRSSDIMRAMVAADQQLDLTIVTDVPDVFWRNRFHGLGEFRWQRRPGRFDVGMVQVDSVRVDIPATRTRVRELLDRRPELIAQEREWLQREAFDLVVSDVAAIPLEAAHAAGIPSVAVANFTWSWIYGEFGWSEEIAAFEAGYRLADLCIETPFAGGLEVFPRRVPVGLLAQAGADARSQIAAQTGADPKLPWVLLSFSTLEWDAAALAEVAALGDVQFLTIEPLGWPGVANIFQVPRRDIRVSDIFASVDTVVTKPGFGVTSDCIVNDKPMVWVDRTGFRETPVLVAEIKRLLRHVEIPEADLYAGRLGPALAAIRTAPPPSEALPTDGAQNAVRAMMKLVAPPE